MSGGTIKSGNLQVGQDGTASNNFTWYQPAVADGTVRLGVGVAGATTSDIMTVNSSGVTINGVISQSAKGSTSNTAFGTQALNANTTGTNNVAIGYQTLYTNTAGTDNTSLGLQAGYNTTGSGNTYLGSQAGYGISSGTENIAIGNLALGGSGITANNNIAIGNGVLYANTSGTQNTAIGGGSYAAAYPAMRFNTSGSYNTALGNQALTSNTTGNSNTCIGWKAGNALTGSQQTIVGYDGATNLTTGNNGIYLGYSTRAGAVGANFEIVIGGATTGKGSQTTYINAGGGASYNGANVTTWATTSDQRIKKNITPLESSLNKIVALNPVEFDYKENDKHEIGFIAQEFETVFPDQIITHDPNEAEKEWVGEDKVKAIQQNLVPYLVKAIQELKAEIDALKGAK